MDESTDAIGARAVHTKTQQGTGDWGCNQDMGRLVERLHQMTGLGTGEQLQVPKASRAKRATLQTFKTNLSGTLEAEEVKRRAESSPGVIASTV